MANLYEFSPCSDAEAVLGGVFRVSVIVAPQGSLLIMRRGPRWHLDRHAGALNSSADRATVRRRH
jgi:hypothetical protein